MIAREIEVKNKLGLHARATAKLVQLAAKFKADIKIKKGEEEVDGKSILGILMLAAGRGSSIMVRTDGPDEREALNAIEDLIERKFDEVE